MTATKYSDFIIPETSEQLPSLMTRCDFIMEQRDQALDQATLAASELASAYQRVKEAVAKVELIASKGLFYFDSKRGDNKDYRSLFNDAFDPEKAIEAFRKSVDTEIWQALINELGIESWMDAQALKEFHEQLAGDVPEVSRENLNATFETLFANRRTMFLRGMANVFGNLDRRFKSHDVFKVRHRIIIERAVGFSGGFCRYSGSAPLLNDVDRCLRKVLGLPDHPGFLLAKLDELQGRTYGPKRIVYEGDYITVKIFLNGNAHVHLSKEAALRVNKALAEYFGDVVPDAAGADMDSDSFQKKYATVPSKDLAYYPTPDDAADELVSYLRVYRGMKILEPSAGTGSLIRALRRKIANGSPYLRPENQVSESDISVDAVEIHGGRADQLRRREGDFCSVTVANFLNVRRFPIYDAVLCNPPFAGTHCMAHVVAAVDHLKPGGQLVAILPITAELGETAEHARFHRWIAKVSKSYRWNELPAGSFASSGTMVNTTILWLKKNG